MGLGDNLVFWGVCMLMRRRLKRIKMDEGSWGGLDFNLEGCGFDLSIVGILLRIASYCAF